MASYQSNDVGSGKRWPENAVNQDGSPADIQWSEENGCYTVNGVLAPLPLSSVPLDITDERTPERVPGSPSRVNEQQPRAGESSGRKPRQSMVFKLFKFVNASEKYLLELHVPDTGVTTWHIIVLTSDITWKVSVTNLSSRNHVDDVQLLSEDPEPPIFHKKHDRPLAERLVGWTFIKNIRKDGKPEKFYYYRDMPFRSFCSVVTFIIYANDAAKNLQLTEPEAAAQQPC